MLKFETYDDAVYAWTDYVKFMREKGHEMGQAWLSDRDNKYGSAAAIPSWVAWQHSVVDAIDTDICWLTTEMMDLVQVAMEGFDPTEKVTVDDIFLPSGFMVLPHAFYSKDVSSKTLAWRLLCWKLVDPMIKVVNDDDEGFAYTYDMTHPDGEPAPGVRFMQVSWVYDEDDWSRENPELMWEVRNQGENWGIAHATAIPLSYMNDEKEISGEGDRQADWLLFWRVAQKLMAETIVTKEHRTPGRPARRDAKRFDMPPPILRVIELRRPSKKSSGEGEQGSARHYTHRWIVRGHWRNQWYPSRGRHAQKYIGSYVAGPEDLELIVKQLVWNWDR
jgi:hypothetical protein